MSTPKKPKSSESKPDGRQIAMYRAAALSARNGKPHAYVWRDKSGVFVPIGSRANLYVGLLGRIEAVFYEDNLIWSTRPVEDRLQNVFGTVPATFEDCLRMLDANVKL